MKEKGINNKELQRTLKSEKFDYNHKGSIQKGFYNKKEGIFAGAIKDNTITTVIKNGASGAKKLGEYVQRLKKTVKSKVSSK